MLQTELFFLFTERLDKAGISYMISGSVATMIYGEPRLTNDIDIILDLEKSQSKILASVFPLEEFYCPPEEVLQIELRRQSRGHFNLIHHKTGHKADIYLCGNDELQHWGLSNRRKVELDEGCLWLAPPEYVILRKLEFHDEGRSEKHIHDLVSMMEMSSEMLNREFLDQKIKEMVLDESWSLVMKSISPVQE